jgi:hypothetical protein
MPRAVPADMQPHASTLVAFGIPALAGLALGLVGLSIGLTSGRRSAVRFGLAAAVWLLLTGAVGLSGFFADFRGMPPRLLLLMLPSLGLPLLLAFSRIGTALLDAPFALLIGVQAFRLPLELVMHRAAREGTMPEQMTFTGWNFDILTGATALLVAALAARGQAPRWLLLGWNTLGSLLLVTILAIAVASLPSFAAFGPEPAQLNTWVGYFPFVWLPAGPVSVAVLGHVLLWRRLLSRGMRGRDFEPLS